MNTPRESDLWSRRVEASEITLRDAGFKKPAMREPKMINSRKGKTEIMKRVLTVTLVACALLLTPMLTSASAFAQDGMKKDDMMKSKKKSLYVRLGGKKAIEAVVTEFINIVAADTRINKFFADAASDPKRLDKLNKNLVNQICEATGGPCKYKGLDMKTAHKGMGVSGADFGALVEDLVKALDKFNVPAAEKNELLGALGPMKGDIVEK